MDYVELDMHVHYHPILDGPHDGKIYTVRAVEMLSSGHDVAWLLGKAGCVSIKNLSPALAAMEAEHGK